MSRRRRRGRASIETVLVIADNLRLPHAAERGWCKDARFDEQHMGRARTIRLLRGVPRLWRRRDPASLSQLWSRRLRRRLAQRPRSRALCRDRPSHRRRGRVDVGVSLVLLRRTIGVSHHPCSPPRRGARRDCGPQRTHGVSAACEVVGRTCHGWSGTAMSALMRYVRHCPRYPSGADAQAPCGPRPQARRWALKPRSCWAAWRAGYRGPQCRDPKSISGPPERFAGAPALAAATVHESTAAY